MINQKLIKIAKPEIPESAIGVVKKIIKSGNLTQGYFVEKLESELAKKTKANYCVAVSNGTSALHTALLAADIGPGDEVITTPFTFAATASAVKMAGAKVVFVDIVRDTFLIDHTQIEACITKKTKAIIAVDLFGQMADLRAISKIAKRHNLTLIEDACQAIGASQEGKPIGYLSDIIILSFYATKLITSGEGGAILTKNRQIAQKAKQLRNHGMSEKKPGVVESLGYNYRMTEIQAALVLSQLKNMNRLINRRQANAKILSRVLDKVEGIKTPKTKTGNIHTFGQYTVVIDKPYPLTRDQLQQKLQKGKVETKIYYPIPLHLQPVFSNLGYKPGDFPVAEETSKKALSLPVHSGVKKEDLDRIIRIIGRN